MITRFVLFVAAFTLEVHVNATELPIQEPRGCLASKDVCAIESHDERGFEFKVGETRVTLDRDASVIRQSASEIRLVRGTIWVQSGQTPVVVSSEFGSARNLDSGQFWVTKTGTELTVLAVSTDVELRPRGAENTLLIEQGLQNSLGKVGFNGQASTGLPMPIAFKDHVLRWGRLYKGPKPEFEADIAKFHSVWEEASQESAAIHKAVYDRKVASREDVIRLEAAKKAKIEAENKALRDLFRRRNGL